MCKNNYPLTRQNVGANGQLYTFRDLRQELKWSIFYTYVLIKLIFI